MRLCPLVSFDTNHPGLNFSGDGRAPDSVTGNFHVPEAQHDAAGNVLKFAADFVQYADGSAQAIRREVRHNSTVALPVAAIQVTALAVDQEVIAESGVVKLFKLVRTGDTTKPLIVHYQLSTENPQGAKGPKQALTACFPAGKNTTHMKVDFVASTATGQSFTFKLKLQPPADGSYAVLGTAAKILVYH